MTLIEIRAGIGGMPPDPEKGRVDLEKIRRSARAGEVLRGRLGREGNSYFVQPRKDIVNPQETPIRLGGSARRVF